MKIIIKALKIIYETFKQVLMFSIFALITFLTYMNVRNLDTVMQVETTHTIMLSICAVIFICYVIQTKRNIITTTNKFMQAIKMKKEKCEILNNKEIKIKISKEGYKELNELRFKFIMTVIFIVSYILFFNIFLTPEYSKTFITAGSFILIAVNAIWLFFMDDIIRIIKNKFKKDK